jgi:hypothetical protein
LEYWYQSRHWSVIMFSSTSNIKKGRSRVSDWGFKMATFSVYFMRCYNFSPTTYSKTNLLPLLPKVKVLTIFIKQWVVKASTDVKERWGELCWNGWLTSGLDNHGKNTPSNTKEGGLNWSGFILSRIIVYLYRVDDNLMDMVIFLDRSDQSRILIWTLHKTNAMFLRKES